MTMTPYEIGRITGQLRAPFDAELAITMAEGIAKGLGMEGDRFTEFMEGYRNGFTEAKQPKPQSDTSNWQRCSDCGFSWPPEVLDAHQCRNSERTQKWRRKMEAERADQEQEADWIPSAAELDTIEADLELPVDEYDPTLCHCGDGFCHGCGEAEEAEEINGAYYL